MRIITLADYGGPYAGSFIPMLRAARRAAEARGWQIESHFGSVAAGRAWLAELRAEGHEAGATEPTRALRARASFVRSRLAAASGPTILHTHFSGWDLPALLAATGQPDVHVVWHLHSPFSAAPRQQVTNRLRFALAGRRVARILCAGPEIYADARARLAPGDRLVLLPNGIDTQRFSPPTAQERAGARAALGHHGDEPLLVHFGWDWPRKGGDLLLAAVSELCGRGHRLRAVTVGAPAQARAAIDAAGLSPAVTVAEPSDDVRSLYAAADAFIAASTAEGLPYSVLEALSMQTPVIASDIPSHRSIAAVAGALRLAAREPGPFADAIAASLTAGDGDRRRLAEERPAFVAAYDLAAWSERLMDQYAAAAR